LNVITVGLYLYPGGLDPQPLQIIEFSYRLVEEVNYEIPIIQEHPVAVPFSLYAEEGESLVLHPPSEVLRDGLYLPAGFTARDEEVIGNGGKLPDLEKDGANSLPLEDYLQADTGLIEWIHVIYIHLSFLCIPLQPPGPKIVSISLSSPFP